MSIQPTITSLAMHIGSSVPRARFRARGAVFLDRDGVINQMVYDSEFGLVDSPQNPAQFDLLPGVGEAIHHINQMGLPVIVVSNQPGMAKGKCTLAGLEAVTAKMIVPKRSR